MREVSPMVDSSWQIIQAMQTRDDDALGLSPRGEALWQVIWARMRAAQYTDALEAAGLMDQGPERDAGLKLIADELVPPTSLNYPNVLGKDRTLALEHLRKVRQIADRIQGGEMKVLLLIRVGVVLRKLGASSPTPGQPVPTDPTLDPEWLLVRAQEIALTLGGPAAPRGEPFRWSQGFLFSGLLGVLGFIVTHVAEPFAGVYGARVAAFLARHAGSSGLAIELEREERRFEAGEERERGDASERSEKVTPRPAPE